AHPVDRPLLTVVIEQPDGHRIDPLGGGEELLERPPPPDDRAGRHRGVELIPLVGAGQRVAQTPLLGPPAPVQPVEVVDRAPLRFLGLGPASSLWWLWPRGPWCGVAGLMDGASDVPLDEARNARELLVQVDLRRGRLRRSLAEALRVAIQDGRLPSGMVLPSSRRLAEDLGVSRGGVSDSFDLLA